MRIARRVFGGMPLSAVRLKTDILEPAGVSVGSFYHQFDGKTELLLALLDDHSRMLREEFRRRRDPAGGLGPESLARALFTFVFDMVDREPDLMRIRLREVGGGDPRVAAFLQRDVARWDRGRQRDYQRLVDACGVRTDLRRAAEMIGLLVEGSLRHYLRAPLEKRPKIRRRLLENLVHFTLHGLPGLEARPS